MLDDPKAPVVVGVVLWVLIALVIVFIQGYGLGSPRAGDTASEAMALIRHHPIGRFVVLPLCTWLGWHWLARPISWPRWSWADVVAIVLGLGWAVLESSRRSS